jgi:hypothetical protein
LVIETQLSDELDHFGDSDAEDDDSHDTKSNKSNNNLQEKYHDEENR